MSEFSPLKLILADVLKIDTAYFNENTPLLGAIPEFDSMAIMMLLVELESEFSLSVADLDLDAENFTTLGHLTAFVNEHKA